jgi:hypothetical protein
MSITDNFPQIFDTSLMPETVYHYTTLQGFYGIVENKAIWANDFRYFNDSDEIVHIFKQLPPMNNDRDFLQKTTFKILGEPNYLIASFSEKLDDLSMWGRYTEDEGLNIGFSRTEVEHLRAVEDRLQQPVIGKCIYNNNEKENIIYDIISIHDGNLGVELLNNLLFIAPFIKNESFKHECEWRMVFKYNPEANDEYGKPKYRISNNSIIPYMNISTKNASDDNFNFRWFESIVLSPKLARNPRAKTMVENYLSSNNIKVGEYLQSLSTLC